MYREEYLMTNLLSSHTYTHTHTHSMFVCFLFVAHCVIRIKKINYCVKFK